MPRDLADSYDEAKFGRALLEPTLDWIAEHFTPTELYGREDLLNHIQSEYEPEDLTWMTEI